MSHSTSDFSEGASKTNTDSRPALYYPYIHIRSEQWLKATLLCTTSVKRIVPDGYTPEDSSRILPYVHSSGPFGPLLDSVPPNSPAAWEAQRRLLSNLKANEEQIARQFNRQAATQLPPYYIHDAKFASLLLDHLVERGLAWSAHDPVAVGHRNWFALHPTLGSAIMTTLGLSIAAEERYDVVTPSVQFHETLLATREVDIFRALLDEKVPSPTTSQASHDLGQLVVTLAGVNLEALRVEDLLALQTSKHFLAFQRLLREKARTIELRDGDDAYQRDLKDTAEEVVEQWRETKHGLRGILADSAVTMGPTVLSEALRQHMTGAPDFFSLGSVGVGLVISTGVQAIRRRRVDPYKYLTEVVNHQAPRVVLPLGLER